jgi:transposase
MGRRADRKRRFTPEFKVEAVRLMHERFAAGLTLQRVSEELELSPDMLRVWAKHVAAAPPDASPAQIFPGHGRRRTGGGSQRNDASPTTRVLSPEEELARLRRENERLRQERDFLKKAAAFFAKESR